MVELISQLPVIAMTKRDADVILDFWNILGEELGLDEADTATAFNDLDRMLHGGAACDNYMIAIDFID
jgi:hypothetical protein